LASTSGEREMQASRRDAEPCMNKAVPARFSRSLNFGPAIDRSVVTARRCARIGNSRSPCPQGEQQ
jgi:hypothetical protein